MSAPTITTKLTPEAVARLQQAKADLLAHAENFDMGTWIRPSSDDIDNAIKRDREALTSDRGMECGTACCIAGFIALREREWVRGDLGATVGTFAAGLLGLPFWEANSLFLAGEWPDSLNLKLDRARTPKGRAKAGAAAIDWFIETHG